MKRRISEYIFIGLTTAATVIVAGCLIAILAAVAIKGLPALKWSMITQSPTGGYYLGGGGGIANAIVGSLYLGLGATALALVISLPTCLYLRVYLKKGRCASWIRLSLDVLWGVPSIVFGAFGFTIMVLLGLRASLLAGIITVALFELPIMIRAMDEVLTMVPSELEEAAYALGATRFETGARVVLRQALPGLVTGILLAFGRGIGDAASVLFTAGFTDNIPCSLLEPAATLPLAIFFHLGTPFEEVHQRAYASALILTILVLLASTLARVFATRFSKHTWR
ncbi:MAG: phosphate ABC transporter permease PstA [Armatimonadetes bacterium]|nr:phosphate ABC transporter permease PstA [Armatimonadota bacterium]